MEKKKKMIQSLLAQEKFWNEIISNDFLPEIVAEFALFHIVE